MTEAAAHGPMRVAIALAELGRATIHGLGWAVLVATMAPLQSVVAAFIGGAIGCLVGARLGRTRLRTSAIIAGGLLLVAVCGWIGSSMTEVSVLAATLGPATALRLAGTWTAISVATVASATMRASSTRKPIFAVFELLLVAVAFAQLFVPHRHGAINRPFYLADWIIALGWDPTWLFLFMGGTATVLASCCCSASTGWVVQF